MMEHNYVIWIPTVLFFYVKAEDFYEDTSNYKVHRPLPTGKNKKAIGLMKNELAGEIMTEFVALRAKIYSYLKNDGDSKKRAKGTKKCRTKRKLEFNDYKDCLLNNKTILKSQQILKNEGHDVNTEKVKKIVPNRNDDKRLQTYDGITTYAYGTNAFIVCKSKLDHYLNNKPFKVSKYKMINSDDYTNENKIEHNPKRPYIPDHPYRILIVRGSGSGKRNTLLNLINNQPDIDKIYLYAKDPYEVKYQHLINKREKVEIDHFNDPKAFIEYSNDMHEVYKKMNAIPLNIAIQIKKRKV